MRPATVSSVMFRTLRLVRGPRASASTRRPSITWRCISACSDDRVVDRVEPIDQPDPLPRLQCGVDFAVGAWAGAVERLEADVDVVVVVGEGEGVVGVGVACQGDDL